MGQKSFKSFAKINISLCIKNKREDGYHELDSIMLPVELHDSLIISPLVGAKDNFVTIDDFSQKLGHYNLVGNCISAFQKKYNIDEKYRIYIHKNIPMQAGLGGGSSNAAVAIKAVNSIKKVNAPNDELIELATPFGADIPFFIPCVPARCKGVGEKITPIEIKNDYHVILIKPKEGISTKEAFALCDKKPYKQVNIDGVEEALREGDDDKLALLIGNSMEDAAIELVPEISEIKRYLYDKGLKIVGMSGSGSTVFALSRDKSLLKKIELDLEDIYFVSLTKVIK